MDHWVLTLDIDPDLQRNYSKFGYGMNIKYERQLPHSFDRFYILAKFHLPKLKDIPVIFNRMPVDYNNCKYLSPCNSISYGHMSWEMTKYSIYVKR